ncbi:MAG: hypothetical protein JO161_00295 [Planctomycetaceae bacterium]|nr:hypothetical protein [Planctomycetaceae bacterium]
MVRDRDGTHRDEYVFSTDTALAVATIMAHSTSRGNIETVNSMLRWWLGSALRKNP